MTEFGMITQVGISRGQTRQHPKGAGPSMPQFLGHSQCMPKQFVLEPQNLVW